MKTIQNHRVRMSGFMMIEALVAVVIVTFGILAIAGLMAKIMTGTSLSKARSEAIVLAEQKQEELRNTVLLSQFSANVAGGGPETITGVNATFTRTWKVCNRAMPTSLTTCGTANTLPVNSMGSLVSVAWSDAKDGSQSVSIASILAWDNPAAAAALKNGGLPGGNFVQKPTGRTTTGSPTGNSYTPGTAPTGSTPHGNGTASYVHDGIAELIDIASGKVLLTTACGTLTDCDFSTISGYVYIDASNNVDPSEVYVLTSDAASCIKSSTTENVPATGTVKYTRFYYTCYVGPAWFGRVGVVRTDNASTNDRVCIGDPAVSTPSTPYLTSREPQLATTRDYRGFKDTTTPLDVYDITVGIGMDASAQYPSAWTYTDKHYGNYDFGNDGTLGASEFDSTLATNYSSTTGLATPSGTTVGLERQDFLITTITGNPTNSDCKAKLELSGVTTASPFYENDGKFVCLTRNVLGSTTPQLPIGCPSTYPTNTAPQTVVTLAFDASHVDNVETDGGTCALSGGTWTCTIDWAGWIGSTWTGTITVTPDNQGKICRVSSNIVSNIVPNDSEYLFANPTQAGGDVGSSASQAPLVLTYSGVKPAVTSFTQTVLAVAKTANCN